MPDLQAVLLTAVLVSALVFPVPILVLLCRHLARVQEQLLLASAALRDDISRRQLVGALAAPAVPEMPEPPTLQSDLNDNHNPDDVMLQARMLGMGPLLGPPAGVPVSPAK